MIEAKSAPIQNDFKLAPPRQRIKRGLSKDDLWIISGMPKSGKTTFVASVPGCVILELEKGGADRIDGWVQDINDLETFGHAIKAAIEEPSVKAIAIDSIDVLSHFLEIEVAAQFGLENMSDNKPGVNKFDAWKKFGLKIKSFVSYVKSSGKTIFLLAHSKEPKIDPTGNVLVPAGIEVPGQSAGHIAAEANIIANCYKKQMGTKTQYCISFQGGPLGNYGSHVKELEDKVIVLPATGQWDAIVAAATIPMEKIEKPQDHTKQDNNRRLHENKIKN